MSSHTARRLLVTGGIVGLAGIAVRALRGGSTTVFDPAPPPAAPPASGWAAPRAGTCPPGYEIKANLRSGIYHRPGMSAYRRTTPDRCYATAEAAEADGLRAAKR